MKISKTSGKIKSDTYDLIVVGGGVGGLYLIYQLLKNKNPNNNIKSILLLEKEDRLGGRIKTITKNNSIQFESGAGRIGKHHLRLNNLLKELGLITTPITNLKTNQKELDQVIKYLEEANKQELESTTITNYLTKKGQNELVEKLYQNFPYYSETHVLNGLLGLEALKDDFNDDKKYYILIGGLEQIITQLEKKIREIAKTKNINLDIKLNQEVTKLSQKNHYLETSSGKYIANNQIVLNLPSKALLKLITKKHQRQLLERVDGEPLYRLYAKYKPEDVSQIEFLWEEKRLLPPPLRFVIPINKEQGLIMISYTDGEETKFWVDKLAEGGNNKVIESINQELKKIYPKITFPKPEWLEHCYYDVGAHYWKPKTLDNSNIQKLVQENVSILDNPNNNILIVGEAYSSHQAWIEGALETAEIAHNKIQSKNQNNYQNKIGGKKSKIKSRIKSKNKSNSRHNKKKINKNNIKNKMNKYTLEEVGKHNTKKDAWIVIDKKVYDITKWIDKHPGGDIIMRGVGRDGTQLFEAFRHSSKAREILKNYLIGELA